MKDKQFVYIYNDVSYPVIVTKKRIKNIIYHYKNGAFYISIPWFAFKNDIIKGLEKFGPKLIEGNKKRNKNIAYCEEYIYLLGQKYDIKNTNHLTFFQEEIEFTDLDDLLRKIKRWFLKYITDRTRYYESIMNLPSYRIKVKDMSSRYGSNSKHTKTIAFASSLLHYHPDIIDSVIVHELAHDVVYNHSKDFYNLVYQYCPNYKLCHKKLRKGEFQ